MFSSTIWISNDSEASARMHGNPVDCLRDRVMAMEHNLETLRTRLFFRTELLFFTTEF